jgi:hypothetical protein
MYARKHSSSVVFEMPIMIKEFEALSWHLKKIWNPMAFLGIEYCFLNIYQSFEKLQRGIPFTGVVCPSIPVPSCELVTSWE